MSGVLMQINCYSFNKLLDAKVGVRNIFTHNHATFHFLFTVAISAVLANCAASVGAIKLAAILANRAGVIFAG